MSEEKALPTLGTVLKDVDAIGSTIERAVNQLDDTLGHYPDGFPMAGELVELGLNEEKADEVLAALEKASDIRNGLGE